MYYIYIYPTYIFSCTACTVVYTCMIGSCCVVGGDLHVIVYVWFVHYLIKNFKNMQCKKE